MHIHDTEKRNLPFSVPTTGSLRFYLSAACLYIPRHAFTHTLRNKCTWSGRKSVSTSGPLSELLARLPEKPSLLWLVSWPTLLWLVTQLQTSHWASCACSGSTYGQHMYREPKSRPFRWTSWDLNSEKIWTVVNGEKQIIFWSRLNWAMDYKYDVRQFKR